MSDPVQTVTDAVEGLEDALPGLLEACTDPAATDMAELLATLQEARVKLQGLERDAELATAKAMMDDYAETPTIRVERSRGTDRKAWDHDGWQRDVRTKAMRAAGLAGLQGVVTADGEVADPGPLWDVLRQLQSAHGATAPKTTTLRKLGLDARDYCESSPGAWKVRVLRKAEETTEQTDEQTTETEGAA